MHARSARLLAASATLAALVLVPLAGEAAAKERRVDCLRTGRTLDANGQVRLFRVGTRQEHVVYVCRLRDRQVIRMGDNGFELTFGPSDPVLAGRFVAGDYGDCSSSGCSSHVQVYDVTRRSYRSDVAPGSLPAHSLLLTRAGVAAWITGVEPPLEDTPVSEHRVEVLLDDGTHVLDQGRIKANSLARSGSRLYWIKDGRPQTATLAEARTAPLR